jgi:hypothetical protein
MKPTYVTSRYTWNKILSQTSRAETQLLLLPEVFLRSKTHSLKIFSLSRKIFIHIYLSHFSTSDMKVFIQCHEEIQ